MKLSKLEVHVSSLTDEQLNKIVFSNYEDSDEVSDAAMYLPRNVECIPKCTCGTEGDIENWSHSEVHRQRVLLEASLIKNMVDCGEISDIEF